MSWFYNLKIGVKLIIGFVFVAVIAGVVGITGIINITSINNADTAMYQLNTVPFEQVLNITKAYDKIRVVMRDLIIDKENTNIENYTSIVNENINTMKSELDVFAKTLQSDEGRKQTDRLKSAIGKFEPYIQKLFNLVKSNQKDQAYSAMQGEGKQLANEMEDPINTLTKLKIDMAKQKSDSNTSAANNAIALMIILVITGMILAVSLGIFISRIISKPIRSMVDAADKLAVGNVNVTIESSTKDEIGILMRSFTGMIENIREQAHAAEKIASGDLTVQVRIKSAEDLLGKKLSEMIETNNDILSNINSAAEQVSAGAKQVSASSQALSQGSTEQASSVEEITASMTEVAAQTKQNAVNANQANELALSAKENALQGNNQMQEMVKAMGEINDSSSNISKIIKVIDEIAFQTNILALNAAVEAARAGQHGKGFAVVAEEVRNLAARSANAAKETTDMIEGSIKKVEKGTKIATVTAEALDKIVDGISKAASLVGNIASASNEQATAISQINQAIEQVAQVVQVNSATSEESAAASEELASQADLLKDAVSRFNLKKNKSSNSLDGYLNSDVIRAIEEMVEKKKAHSSFHESKEPSEVGVSKMKIALEDKDFGKY